MNHSASNDKKPLIILGDGLFADIAYEYFTHDSLYEVIGFSVDREYLRSHQKFGLPIQPFDEIQKHFDPAQCSFFAAITYGQLNRVRERFFIEAKAKGYTPASYISSRAFVWHNVKLGEHCFIFENNTIQPFSVLGHNVVLWSGNHIGHHSAIDDHVFIASQVVISGNCRIASHCFLGVNSTISNGVVVGQDCVIGAGALVGKDLAADSVVRGPRYESSAGAQRLFKVAHA